METAVSSLLDTKNILIIKLLIDNSLISKELFMSSLNVCSKNNNWDIPFVLEIIGIIEYFDELDSK